MADHSSRQDPLADVITLLAAPLAGGLRAVDQVRRGTDELIRTVENLNQTLESLNQTSQRINALLADLEEPVRAAIPQLTRTIRTADEISQMLEGPIRTMAPTLPALAEVVASTPVELFPNQFAEMLNTMRDVSARLAPLVQLAENAGGLFGALRLPGLSGGSRTTRPASSTPRSDPALPASGSSTSAQSAGRAANTTAAKTAVADDSGDASPPKRAAKKKTPAKKSPAKKASAKKSAAKKASKNSAAPKKASKTNPVAKETVGTGSADVPSAARRRANQPAERTSPGE